MNSRNPIVTLLILVALLAVAATLGAIVAGTAPTPRPGSVEPRNAHVVPAPRTGVRAQRRPVRRPNGGDVDITAYVNLYAIGGALTCFAVLAYWGWWQTHHRCPTCGSCPAWCRCGEATRPHRR